MTGTGGCTSAGRLAAGLVLAVVLVALPFIPGGENVLTGVVLLAFALGWALLALLSVRLTDQPQRWAAAPAVFLAVAGLISLLLPGSVVQDVFGWQYTDADGRLKVRHAIERVISHEHGAVQGELDFGGEDGSEGA